MIKFCLVYVWFRSVWVSFVFVCFWFVVSIESYKILIGIWKEFYKFLNIWKRIKEFIRYYLIIINFQFIFCGRRARTGTWGSQRFRSGLGGWAVVYESDHSPRMRSWWVGWPARPDPHATSRSGGAGLRSGLGEKCFGGISPFLNLTICMLHGHRLSWMLVWGGGWAVVWMG